MSPMPKEILTWDFPDGQELALVDIKAYIVEDALVSKALRDMLEFNNVLFHLLFVKSGE